MPYAGRRYIYKCVCGVCQPITCQYPGSPLPVWSSLQLQLQPSFLQYLGMDATAPAYTELNQILKCVYVTQCFVPETLENAYDLEDAVQAMDGRDHSTPNALGVIQALMRHRTPLLLVILDGQELPEYDNTVLYLRSLISILHSRQIDSRYKVLLGSQGFLVTCGHLDMDERVDCTLPPGRRPGRAQPGGRLVGGLDSFPM